MNAGVAGPRSAPRAPRRARLAVALAVLALAGTGIVLGSGALAGLLWGASSAGSGATVEPATLPPAGSGAASGGPSDGLAAGSRFHGDGYGITVPAGLGTNPMRIGQGDFWTQSGANGLQGLSVGRLALPSGSAGTLDDAVRQMEADMAVPGHSEFSAPVAVAIPAGPAARVTMQVASMQFACYAVTDGSRAYRIVLVNVSEADAGRIVATFAFEQAPAARRRIVSGGGAVAIADRGAGGLPLYTRTGGGSGLGLSIVRALATAHGGVVSAENLAPSGARVTVLVRRVPVPGTPAGPGAA